MENGKNARTLPNLAVNILLDDLQLCLVRQDYECAASIISAISLKTGYAGYTPIFRSTEVLSNLHNAKIANESFFEKAMKYMSLKKSLSDKSQETKENILVRMTIEQSILCLARHDRIKDAYDNLTAYLSLQKYQSITDFHILAGRFAFSLWKRDGTPMRRRSLSTSTSIRDSIYVEKAETHFKKALDLNPTLLTAIAHLYEILSHKHRLQDLVPILKKFLYHYPSNPIALGYYLEVLSVVEDDSLLNERRAIAIHLLKIDPVNIAALKTLHTMLATDGCISMEEYKNVTQGLDAYLECYPDMQKYIIQDNHPLFQE